MAGTRIISVIGRKNAGKTTLVVALAGEFVRRGRAVGTIKHGHHTAEMDPEGKDTWRHFHEGHAARVMIESPGRRVTLERSDGDADPAALVARYFDDMDIVILEGFKKRPLPKVEVHRRSEHPAPLYEPARPDAGDWIAVVTDDRTLRLPIPVFCFTDTSWFTNLAHLVWEKAPPIPASR